MNAQQRRALNHPTYFGFETLRPKFGRKRLHHSEVLTVNQGYE